MFFDNLQIQGHVPILRFWVEYKYDGLGRPIVQYTGYGTGETPETTGTWTAADTVGSNDTIVQQTQTWYDAASNAVASATFQRLPGSSITGSLSGSNGLSAAYSYVSASAVWHDGIGRTVETVNYGHEKTTDLTHYFFDANGTLIDTSPADGIPDVAENAPPAPNTSDDYIVSRTAYNPAGDAYETIDNLGRINETLYDAAGRTVRTIQNFDGFAYGASGSGFNSDGSVKETDTDHDVTVDYQYDAAGGWPR